MCGGRRNLCREQRMAYELDGTRVNCTESDKAWTLLPPGPRGAGEVGREIQRGGVRGKGSLISCSIGLCFLCDGRGQVTVLERGVGVLGREQGLRIQGKVRKGLLM